MLQLTQESQQNSYPGRGIVIGKSADGKSAVTAYFIMGRSTNSRNRVFVEDGDGIRTQAHDPSKLEDPHLIIYAGLFVKLRCWCYQAAARCGIFRPRCGRTEIVKPYPALCAAYAGALHRVLRADTIYEFAFVQEQKGLGIAQFDIGLLLGIGGFLTAETNQPNLAGL